VTLTDEGDAGSDEVCSPSLVRVHAGEFSEAKFIRAARCKYTAHISGDVLPETPLAQYGEQIDSFLQNHAGWRVEQEPRAGGPGGTRVGADIQLFRRTDPATLRLYELFVESQYPKDEAECLKRTILVSNEPGRYIGSVGYIWSATLSTALSAKVIMFPAMEANNEGWELVGSDCTKPSKIDCYLLPLTSCRPPRDFENCTGRTPRFEHDVCPGRYSLYSPGNVSMGRDTVWRNLDEPHPDRGWPTEVGWEHGKNPTKELLEVEEEPTFIGDSLESYWLWLRSHHMGLFFRYNFDTRAVIQQRIRRFESSERARGAAWDRGAPCAAVHIRRGDKLADPSTYGASDRRTSELESFNHTIDEFVELTSKLLEKAAGSDSTQQKPHLFVLTDDPGYVLANRDRFPNHNIHVLEREPPADDGELAAYIEKMRDQMPTDQQDVLADKPQPSYASNAELLEVHGQEMGWKLIRRQDINRNRDTIDMFASFEIAQTCTALVGNMGSGITTIVHRFMCLYHNRCPEYDSFARNDEDGGIMWYVQVP
jgi:hypothetical protein